MCDILTLRQHTEEMASVIEYVGFLLDDVPNIRFILASPLNVDNSAGFLEVQAPNPKVDGGQ